MRILERELYGEIGSWLEARLGILFPGWDIEVFDTSKFALSGFLGRMALDGAIPGAEAFEIEVDLTGVLRQGNKTALAFVECKAGAICLKDLGQILGYSRVAIPVISVLLSPAGLSRSLDLLLNAYNRIDLLEYGSGRRIKVGTWDRARKQVDPASVIPPGELG